MCKRKVNIVISNINKRRWCVYLYRREITLISLWASRSSFKSEHDLREDPIAFILQSDKET